MPEVNKGIINTGTIGGSAILKQQEKHVGDNITVNADHSMVNLKGRMENISLKLNNSDLLPDGRKQELEDLFGQFVAMIPAVAEKKPEEAERLTDYLEMLSKELNRDKPQKTFVQSMWSNIKQTVKVVGDALPDVIGLCSRLEKIFVALAL